LIRFDDVSYSYRAQSGEYAVCGVSFALGAGEMLAILGANGSGKSTLARLCNGLLLPSSGSVVVDGVDTSDDDRAFEVRSAVGMVFQHPEDQIVATAVEDDVAFGPENLGLPRAEIRARVDEALEQVGLTGLERREPHLLSGGQKQRLAIAGALAMQPAYLVFDEPTSMIDSQGRAEVAEVLRRLRTSGRGVLLITHDVAEASMADRVIVLAGGRTVFEAAPDALVGHPDLASWGLELPPLSVLARELRALGLSAPAVPDDPAMLVTQLCP
jgi:energy-coupling factor transporter ATPase